MTAGVMTIGKCKSTVGYRPGYTLPPKKPLIFNFPRVAERLIIATPAAWDHLNDPLCLELLAAIDSDIKQGNLESRNGALETSPWGGPLVKKVYGGRNENWVTFGIRLFRSLETDNTYDELTLYEEAEKLIHNTAPGIGRRIFFGSMGIEVEGIGLLQNLSEDHYMVLLGMLTISKDAEESKHWKFKDIRKLTLADSNKAVSNLAIYDGEKGAEDAWISTWQISQLAQNRTQRRIRPLLKRSLKILS